MKRIISILLSLVIFASALSLSSLTASAAYPIDTPRFTDISVIDGGIKFTWDSMGDDVLYRIYWKSSNGWTKMITTADTSFVERDVHAGKGFTYTIRCVNKNQNDFLSDFNRTGWYVPYYDTPVVDEVTSTKLPSGIYQYNISWSNVNAPTYRIDMRYEGETKWRTIIKRCNGTSYSYAAPADTEQNDPTRLRTYRVCAINPSTNPKIVSAYGYSPYYMPSDEYSKLKIHPLKADAAGWYYAVMWAKDTLPANLKQYAVTTNDSSELLGYRVNNNDNKISTDVMKAAYDQHMYSGTDTRLVSLRYYPCRRQFIANSLKLAFDYKKQALGSIYSSGSDLSVFSQSGSRLFAKDTKDNSMNTVAHYGWFEPDYYGNLYPNHLTSSADMDNLLSELMLYKKWHGKTVVSFGDSIMHGSGNAELSAQVTNNSGDANYIHKVFTDTKADNNRKDFSNKRYARYDSVKFKGMCEFIGEKYGMIHKDYSYPGATIGTELQENKDSASTAKWMFRDDAPYKSHIANQIRTAIREGQKADLVLIDGGINDTHLGWINWRVNHEGRVYDYGYYPADEYSGWATAANNDGKLYHGLYGHRKSLLPEYYATENSFESGLIKALSLLTGSDSEAVNSKMKNATVIYVLPQEAYYRDNDPSNLCRQQMFRTIVRNTVKNYASDCKIADIYQSGLSGNYSVANRLYYRDDYRNASANRGIHPNAYGYMQFYVPTIEGQMH